jgi:O-antigen/teichoic acid export membrane protein
LASIKQLAGQTIWYGVSSILARLLNYLLIIVHTQVFLREEYAIITKLYAYTAFFLVLCTFGMETAFFRFASKNKEKKDHVFTQANSFVILISLLVTGFIFLNGQAIANVLNYSDQAYLIRMLAIIICIDAVVAIPFAQLRLDNRPMFFALIRVVSIILQIVLNLVFLLVFPAISKGEYLVFLQPLVNSIYNPDYGVGYVFLANLLGNLIMLVFLGKYVIKLSLKFDWVMFKPMLIYSIPILITGFSGMANENLDKILIPELLSDDFYPDKTSEQALGVYGAVYKLSVFMLLAIQAFRYAAEPFFFSNAEDKGAPHLFARVMYYFVLVNLIIFVGVTLNMNLIADIFIRNRAYHDGLFVVPYLLTGKLFFGIYINLSIWFKLTSKTYYGTYFSILGAVVTIIGNVLLIPIIGYLGSAITLILCYLTMTAVCYYYGQKYFYIPYDVKKIFLQIGGAIAFSVLIFNIEFDNQWVNYSIGIVCTFIYIGYLVVTERKKLLRQRINTTKDASKNS